MRPGSKINMTHMNYFSQPQQKKIRLLQMRSCDSQNWPDKLNTIATIKFWNVQQQYKKQTRPRIEMTQSLWIRAAKMSCNSIFLIKV